jgi:hypothetical protein
VGLVLRTIGCWVAEKPKLPNNFEDITWAKIKEAVTAIHQKQPVTCSLEELYRVINQFLFRLINLARVYGIQVYHIECYVCLINAPFCRQLKICACIKWLATYIVGFVTRSLVPGWTHLRVHQCEIAESWDRRVRSRLPTLKRGRGSSWEPRD